MGFISKHIHVHLWGNGRDCYSDDLCDPRPFGVQWLYSPIVHLFWDHLITRQLCPLLCHTHCSILYRYIIYTRQQEYMNSCRRLCMLSRLYACNKSHIQSLPCMTYITRSVRGRRDIKHIIIAWEILAIIILYHNYEKSLYTVVKESKLYRIDVTA